MIAKMPPKLNLERISKDATEIHELMEKHGRFGMNYHPIHLATVMELNRLKFPQKVRLPEHFPKTGYYEPSTMKYFIGILSANHDYEIYGSENTIKELSRIVRMGEVTSSDGFKSSVALPIRD